VRCERLRRVHQHVRWMVHDPAVVTSAWMHAVVGWLVWLLEFFKRQPSKEPTLSKDTSKWICWRSRYEASSIAVLVQ
jgi:hypothetical protein